MLITLNRPKVLNSLSSEVFSELKTVFEKMRDDQEVKVVVVTGAGDKAFAAGSDVSEMSQYSLVEAREFALQVNKAQQAIAHFPKPTIAAINGFAFGGGLEVAMCCDIRIASEKAKMGQPEINLGIIPGGGGTQRLSRLIGLGRAKELVYTGLPISAQRAYEIGLVNQVVPHEHLIGEALKLAKKIAEKSSVTLKFAKSAMDTGIDMDLENALKTEIELFAECFGTEDGKEGLSAFTEKRKPNFADK
ncbi:MAG: enoyl-CoA hydratase/isomerase family protein [Syntrophomonadaceae bacterium]|nr:enoyl-CoA hydratase/isomerase family protein [Syntrophomonadaceae bacterium]